MADPHLEQAADALARRVLAEHPPGRDRTAADLDRLPPALAHYLRARLARRLRREAALPASAWLDAEAPAVVSAAKAWREAVEGAGRIPGAAWAETVAAGARAVAGYLVHPAPTAAAVVFEGEEAGATLPPSVVARRLSAFAAYPHLREIAEGYLGRKETDGVDRVALERLLDRIDLRMVAGFGGADWAALAAPLFALLGAVPGPLVRAFFEARGQGALGGAFTADAYDEAVFQQTLAQRLPGPPLPAASVPPPVAGLQPLGALGSTSVAPPVGEAPEVRADLDAPGGRTEGPEAPPAPASVPDPSEPLWQRLAREQSAGPAPAPLPVEAAPWARPDADAPPVPASPSPAPSGVPYPPYQAPPVAVSAPSGTDLGVRRPTLARLEASVLGPDATEQRSWFVTRLTGGSETDYRAVLERLDAAGSWDEAWRIIAGDLFKKHGVDIYDEAAIAFTDAVESRFAR